MRITAAKAFLERLPAVSRKDNAAQVMDERDDDGAENSDDLEFRKRVRRKQGYGVFVDKTI